MKTLTVILHNIRSTYNVGAILRTCEGLGVSKVIFSGYTPFWGRGLPHQREKLLRQIHKTALGAEQMIDCAYTADLVKFIEVAKRRNTHILALEQAKNSVNLRSLRQLPLPKDCLLILGEEVQGITEEILALTDTIIEIPMAGHKESFNVSVATGIALWELTNAQSERTKYPDTRLPNQSPPPTP